MQGRIARYVVLPLCLAVVAAATVLAAPAKEIEIGKKAPDFKLKGVDGKEYSLKQALKKNKVVVVTFTCNHCPVAKAYEDRLIAFQKEYKDAKVQILAISSNDTVSLPADSFENMQKRAKEKKFNFPYLFDETQEVAKAYGARVTPHLFVVNSEGTVVYRGAFDNSQNPKTVKEHYLKDAVDALLAGKEIAKNATKAFGCTIKWKRGS